MTWFVPRHTSTSGSVDPMAVTSRSQAGTKDQATAEVGTWSAPPVGPKVRALKVSWAAEGLGSASDKALNTKAMMRQANGFASGVSILTGYMERSKEVKDNALSGPPRLAQDTRIPPLSLHWRKPPSEYPENTRKPYGRQPVGTQKPPGEYPENTLRITSGHPETTAGLRVFLI
jgi:hypothetical protein